MMRNGARVLGAAMASASSDSTGSAAVVERPLEELPVYLKPSRSSRRKSSFYIPRMREVVPDAQALRAADLGSAAPLFAITARSCEYFALRLPLLKAGFKRLPLTGGDVSTECNVVWGKAARCSRQPGASGRVIYTHAMVPSVSSRSAPDQRNLLLPPDVLTNTLALGNPFQKFNHFPGSHKNLGCKRGMARSIMLTERMLAHDSVKFGNGVSRHLSDMYAFSPKTWFYPEHKDSMVQAFKTASPNSHFIWKPARGSCGRGILLSQGGEAHQQSWVNVMQEIEEKVSREVFGRAYRHYVVQQYVENPLLLEGRKMDLRLYVTVTSYNPLTVYLHEEGLVRLAAEPYHADAETTAARGLSGSVMAYDGDNSARIGEGDRADQCVGKAFDSLFISAGDRQEAAEAVELARGRFRHLTNFSVGRRHHAYRQGHQPASVLADATQSTATVVPTASVGSPTEAAPELKWTLQRLWAHLDAQQASPDSAAPRSSEVVKEKIALLITRTLLAARPSLCKAAADAATKCGYFELYGFDVLLDEARNPFLIEINTLPSLESSSDIDYATKCNVVSDMLNLAMIEPFARDTAALQPFTNNAALLQPPASSLKAAVRAVGEPSFSLDELSEQEQREEIRSTLADELMYCRGFKRIFPPVRCADASSGSPLTCDSPAVQDDLRTFASYGMLTPRDCMALE